MIQYAAIVRAQRIMLVKHHNDMTKELRKEKSSLSAEEVEYEIQFAWDKQATFMDAQSRAMRFMHMFFDSILMHLEHYEMPCTFVLSNEKSLKGNVVGRDQYMIYVETEEKQHFLFKFNVMDVIPNEKIDLKKAKEAVKNHLARKKAVLNT